MLDLISDVLRRLSLQGTLYFHSSFTPPFGIAVPPFERVARFHFVRRGEVHVHVDPLGTTLHLRQGDLVIIPHGAPHRLLSQGTAPEEASDLDDVLETSGFTGEGVLVYGGGETAHETQLICGHFAFAEGSRHPLLDRLPPFILLRDYGQTAGDWLGASLAVIGSEAGENRPGGDLVALKVSETLLVHAIRDFIESAEGRASGLAGFTDDRLARVLQAIHDAPDKAWTVAAMARTAGQSRTAFARSFAEKMGVTPIQYVTDWRMQLARQTLAQGGISVAEVAAMTGYASEAAFSRVFKRQVGIPPGQYRAGGRIRDQRGAGFVGTRPMGRR